MDRNQDIFITYIPTEWVILLFLIGVGTIYWAINKKIGFQVLYLTLFSMSVAQIITLHFPYLYTNDELLPFTHPQVQIMMTFFSFFIPLCRTRKAIILCLLPPLLTSVLFIAFGAVPLFSIVGAILIGGFIIYTFYRTLDWIGSMPEPYIIIFAIILPVFLAAIIHPTEKLLIYPGILLGAGIGYTLESFKVRMKIPKPPHIRGLLASIIGISGIIVLYGIDRLVYQWVPTTEITIGLVLGLWITLIVPILITAVKLYKTEGHSRIFF
ncbi:MULTISPECIES: hypothetical protein [Bacillaceae]|uniref:Uncharacterized protein n=1 Tax=Evansella alkalicola TaxID=745819 RepID=A0ABS6K0K5_9BACI|nr:MULTISPECIES: hypothetical protein [Bacillaceae]MBU9724180.1 hypothetical protein [Bacillus alkalicola]